MAFIEVVATSLSSPAHERKETSVCLDVETIESFGRALTGLGTIFTLKTGRSLETTASYGKVKDYMKGHGVAIIDLTNRPNGG